MLKVGIIAGTSRPGAMNPQVVAWVEQQLAARDDVEAAVVRFSDYNLPLLDEEIPGGAHKYAHEHTKAWGRALEPFDAFIVVTPEYNHSMPGSLKNALDYVSVEFAHKPVGFVGYGGTGASRAVEQLRLVFANMSAPTVRTQPGFFLDHDFTGDKFTPRDAAVKPFQSLMRDLLLWGDALRGVRAQLAAD